MELASRIRWILVIGLAVVFLILIGWGLFSIANNLFRGTTGDRSVEEVSSYNVTSTATARFTVDGPVVANEDHRSFVIEVSQNVVSMRVYSSYGQTVIAQQSYQNTQPAFDTFLNALENEQVTNRLGNTTTDDDEAESGVCPRGRRFIVELDSDVRRWGTTCSRREGTAGFNMTSIRTLFQRQVPDYRDLVRGTGL